MSAQQAQETAQATESQDLNLRGGGTSDAGSERTDNSDPPSPPSSTGHKSSNDEDYYDYSDADADRDSDCADRYQESQGRIQGAESVSDRSS